MMTMSPEGNSGTGIFSTQVSKARRSIGPSSTKGAVLEAIHREWMRTEAERQ